MISAEWIARFASSRRILERPPVPWPPEMFEDDDTVSLRRRIPRVHGAAPPMLAPVRPLRLATISATIAIAISAAD